MGKKVFNRELSWLSFNHRVLQEAADSRVPLLERIRFLGIFSNNLDEFFKVRVATIKRMIDIQEKNQTVEGEKPQKVLTLIQNKVLALQEEFQRIFQGIVKELEEANIFIINEKQLSQSQADYVKEYFEDKVLPALSPIMIQNLDSIPFIRDKSNYLAVKLSHSERKESTQFALIEIPSSSVGRFLVLPQDGSKKYIILLDDVIRFCLKDVFAIFNYDTFDAYVIKLTRDAELDLDNDLSQSFLERISKGVSDRKTGQPVRFVYDGTMPRDMFNYLTKKLGLDDDDNMIPGARYHNFKDFMGFPIMGLQELTYPETPSNDHQFIDSSRSILELINKQDLLLHCPYQKFSHFINLLREAAIDPHVQSISITLYRVAQNSKVVQALINAARNGKQVTVVLELQARFDERTNIYFAKKFEEAGITVIFGIKGLKVHAKLALIVRRESRKMVHYAAVGTGNFHEGNAGIYTDMTLFTKDKRITSDVKRIFDMFSETYHNYNFKYLLVSPLSMRKKLTELINREIRNAKMGRPAFIDLKVNHLVDRSMVTRLFEAAQSGVKVRLIVRGICSIYTGTEDVHANLEAISIVDKFLEHSRYFIFCNNNNPQFYISSADWMTRNLDHRIEVACPIYAPELQQELRTIFEIQWSDNYKARVINENQDNPYRRNSLGTVHSQMALYRYYEEKSLASVPS